jgi:uncharacterized hydrophobic protein (TIGR00271 family)
VLEIARARHGTNLACFEATGPAGALDMAIVHVSNENVGRLIEELQRLPELHLTLIPQGVMALRPPASEAPGQVTDVAARSPIEVFLAGLQSVGSWKGFLGYAAASGVVAWIGLFTNTIYLLTAAMLIAPFAGPAMNAALATARGDGQLLRRALMRYAAALGVAIVVAAALSLILRQKIATSLMAATSELSTVAALLPLVAGAAGALNLVQSERSSLVSGAAVGMLVAASLAPPAAVVGIASVLRDWAMVKSGLFVLMLQLVGINVSAAIVFRRYGLTDEGVRYRRGKQQVFVSALAVTALALIGLVTWQLWDQPGLQRSTVAERATAEIQRVVNDSDLAKLVEANVRFTSAEISGQNTLLGVVYVQRGAPASVSAEEIRTRLRDAIQARLLAREGKVTPLIDVSVLEPPAGR